MTDGEGVAPVTGSPSGHESSNGGGATAAKPEKTDITMVSDAPARTPPDPLTGFATAEWKPAAPGTARRGWPTPPWVGEGDEGDADDDADNTDRTAGDHDSRRVPRNGNGTTAPAPDRPNGRRWLASSTVLDKGTATITVPTLAATKVASRPPAPDVELPVSFVERPQPRRPAGSGTGTGKLPYNPALDGIRGLAVAAVLLFHGEFVWARGGFLGVSTFFTLSGFLITSLVVGERLSTGRIGLTAFWARRLRRLLPASVLTLGLVALSALATAEVWERSLRGDVIAAALNVANWRFLLADASYAERFASPSPVLHFWSLAIEEQFYWVFPVLAAGVFRLARGSRRVFGAVLLGLLGVSAGLTLLYSDSPDTIYYATPIRMGEILVGAFLAVVVARGAVVGSRRLGLLVAVGGIAALAATLWAWWNVEEATTALYDGGLLAYAVVSGLLVLAACVPGPVRWLLSLEPLRLLGVVSYGVYLFHWPIFLLLDEDRVDGLFEPLDLHPRGVNLFVVRLVPTLLLAVASYRWLERPIRRGRRPRRVKAAGLAGAAVATVVALAIVVPWASPPPPDPFAVMAEAAAGPDPAELTPDAHIGVTLGDSTMLMTGWGLSSWGHANHRLVIPGGAGGVGCGIGRGGSVEYSGARGELGDACEGWATTLVEEVDAARDRYGHVDFAVVQTGPWDIANRQLEGDDEWRHIGDPVYDEYLREEFDAANDLLLDEGLRVIWLTAPTIEVGRDENPRPEDDYPESNPERMQRLNGLITQMAAERQGVVVVDLAAYVASLSAAEDDRLRPDGVHFTEETAPEVAEAFLGEEVLAAVDREPLPETDPATGTPTDGTEPAAQ